MTHTHAVVKKMLAELSLMQLGNEHTYFKNYLLLSKVARILN